MRVFIILAIVMISCESERVSRNLYILNNMHYFDFQKDSMVFSVQGSFATDREVWLKKSKEVNDVDFVLYHKVRNGRLYDSFNIRPGENRAEVLRRRFGATLQLFNLYWMSDSVNRFLLSNGSNFTETAGFYTMKQTCPWPFFTGKYILCQYEYNQRVNDSVSIKQITKEWYARDTGIIYFERTSDSLKFGKKFRGKSERGIRQSF